MSQVGYGSMHGRKCKADNQWKNIIDDGVTDDEVTDGKTSFLCLFHVPSVLWQHAWQKV